MRTSIKTTFGYTELHREVTEGHGVKRNQFSVDLFAGLGGSHAVIFKLVI